MWVVWAAMFPPHMAEGEFGGNEADMWCGGAIVPLTGRWEMLCLGSAGD